MNDAHRGAFIVTATLSTCAGFWAYGWYEAAPATYSDLSEYGIEYGGEAFIRIAKNTQELIRLVAVPLFSMLLIALTGWGYCIFSGPGRDT
jgi:hypothetical protein